MTLGTDDDGYPCDETWKYASVVGMLMNLSSNPRPDIQLAVHQCASFTQNSMMSHDEAVKSIFHYLVGTQEQGLTFYPYSDMKLD